jgi:hypothetical protein
MGKKTLNTLSPSLYCYSLSLYPLLFCWLPILLPAAAAAAAAAVFTVAAFTGKRSRCRLDEG